MKKKVLVCMLAAAMVFGGTSCSSDKKSEKETAPSSTAPSSKEMTDGSFQASKDLDPEYACTIDVVGSWGNFEALDQAAQDFGKYYPNIEVLYSSLNDVKTDIENRMASGKGIDIYMHNWFNINDSSKAYLWENAEDLSQIGLNPEILDTDLLNTGYVDGKLKMVPLYRRSYGFMVNEDLLKAHDLAIPKTYEEFLACCEAFKKEGISPVLLQEPITLTNTYNQHVIAQTIKNKDRDKIMADALEGKDSSGIIGDTLQMMADLTDKGYVHPDSYQLENGYEAVILRFFEGDIPFVPYHSDYFSGTRKREAKSESFTAHPFTYQFIPFPGEDGYECVFDQLGTLYLGVYDNIAEEKKPYVHELLRYLFSDEGSYTMGHVKNMTTINLNTGFTDFPYLQSLTNDQIFVVGKDGLRLDYSELLLEAYANYTYGMTAEDYLKQSIQYIKDKEK